MASVRLGRYEAENGELPLVCMRCGAEGSVWKSKKFVWQPSWIAVLILGGLLPYIIVSLILQKRMRVKVALCPVHQYHWGKRIIFNLVCLAFFGMLIAAMIAIPIVLKLDHRTSDSFFGFLCLSIIGFGLIWLIANVVIDAKMIRPTEITDRTITLKGVHQDYRAALARWRSEQGGGDDADDAPPRPRPAGDPKQIYDPNARRRPATDDDR